MASDYLAMGMMERAAAEVSRALARDASPGVGYTLLGEIYARQGFHGEALERFRRALREGGESLAARAGEVRSLLALKRSRDALPLAESLASEHQSDVDVLMLLAATRADVGDPAGALATLDTARTLAPHRPDVHQKIGDIARSLGDNEGAILAYRRALELDNEVAVVRYQLARLLRAKGQVRESEQQLVAALESVPTYTEATLELASLAVATGHPEDALLQLIALLERDPYHLEALLGLGETLYALGRLKDAGQAFRRILRFEPAHVGALYYDGVLLNEQKRYRDAVARWERVVSLEPNSEFARRARRAARTASNLQSIFASERGG
jgi:tetratricopeptide (TPR) repeat protein